MCLLFSAHHQGWNFPCRRQQEKKDWPRVSSQAQHELQEANCCFRDEFGPVNVTLAHSEHKMPFLKMSIDFYDKRNIAEYEHKCVIPLLQRCYKFCIILVGQVLQGDWSSHLNMGGPDGKSQTREFQD